MSRRIILASTSFQRKELLAKTGLVFETIAGKYEEDMTLNLSPHELAMHLSKGKVQSIVSNYSDAIIIGADTFIVYKDKVIGKPHTEEKAKEILQMLRGNHHLVISGFTIIDTKSGKIFSNAIESKVYFKNYTDEEIDNYIATGEPLDKGGAYAIQGIGGKLVEKVEGDYDNIVGLPVKNIFEALKDFGITI